MPGGCDTYSQHAWKKDLCVNCMQHKSTHPEIYKRPIPARRTTKQGSRSSESPDTKCDQSMEVLTSKVQGEIKDTTQKKNDTEAGVSHKSQNQRKSSLGAKPSLPQKPELTKPKIIKEKPNIRDKGMVGKNGICEGSKGRNESTQAKTSEKKDAQVQSGNSLKRNKFAVPKTSKDLNKSAPVPKASVKPVPRQPIPNAKDKEKGVTQPTGRINQPDRESSPPVQNGVTYNNESNPFSRESSPASVSHYYHKYDMGIKSACSTPQRDREKKAEEESKIQDIVHKHVAVQQYKLETDSKSTPRFESKPNESKHVVLPYTIVDVSAFPPDVDPSTRVSPPRLPDTPAPIKEGSALKNGNRAIACQAALRRSLSPAPPHTKSLPCSRKTSESSRSSAERETCQTISNPRREGFKKSGSPSEICMSPSEPRLPIILYDEAEKMKVEMRSPTPPRKVPILIQPQTEIFGDDYEPIDVEDEGDEKTKEDNANGKMTASVDKAKGENGSTRNESPSRSTEFEAKLAAIASVDLSVGRSQSKRINEMKESELKLDISPVFEEKSNKQEPVKQSSVESMGSPSRSDKSRKSGRSFFKKLLRRGGKDSEQNSVEEDSQLGPLVQQEGVEEEKSPDILDNGETTREKSSSPQMERRVKEETMNEKSLMEELKQGVRRKSKENTSCLNLELKETNTSRLTHEEDKTKLKFKKDRSQSQESIDSDLIQYTSNSIKGLVNDIKTYTEKGDGDDGPPVPPKRFESITADEDTEDVKLPTKMKRSVMGRKQKPEARVKPVRDNRKSSLLPPSVPPPAPPVSPGSESSVSPKSSQDPPSFSAAPSVMNGNSVVPPFSPAPLACNEVLPKEVLKTYRNKSEESDTSQFNQDPENKQPKRKSLPGGTAKLQISAPVAVHSISGSTQPLVEPSNSRDDYGGLSPRSTESQTSEEVDSKHDSTDPTPMTSPTRRWSKDSDVSGDGLDYDTGLGDRRRSRSRSDRASHVKRMAMAPPPPPPTSPPARSVSVPRDSRNEPESEKKKETSPVNADSMPVVHTSLPKPMNRNNESRKSLGASMKEKFSKEDGLFRIKRRPRCSRSKTLSEGIKIEPEWKGFAEMKSLPLDKRISKFMDRALPSPPKEIEEVKSQTVQDTEVRGILENVYELISPEEEEEDGADMPIFLGPKDNYGERDEEVYDELDEAMKSSKSTSSCGSQSSGSTYCTNIINGVLVRGELSQNSLYLEPVSQTSSDSQKEDEESPESIRKQPKFEPPRLRSLRSIEKRNKPQAPAALEPRNLRINGTGVQQYVLMYANNEIIMDRKTAINPFEGFQKMAALSLSTLVQLTEIRYAELLNMDTKIEESTKWCDFHLTTSKPMSATGHWTFYGAKNSELKPCDCIVMVSPSPAPKTILEHYHLHIINPRGMIQDKISSDYFTEMEGTDNKVYNFNGLVETNVIILNSGSVTTLQNYMTLLHDLKTDVDDFERIVCYCLLQIIYGLMYLNDQGALTSCLHEKDILVVTSSAKEERYIVLNPYCSSTTTKTNLSTYCTTLVKLVSKFLKLAIPSDDSYFSLQIPSKSCFSKGLQKVVQILKGQDLQALLTARNVLEFMLWGPKEEEIKPLTLAEDRQQAFSVWLEVERCRMVNKYALLSEQPSVEDICLMKFLCATTGSTLFDSTKLLHS